MVLGEAVEITGIPFIEKTQMAGKFLSSLVFYDEGKWRTWLLIGDEKYVEVQAKPAEYLYYGARKALDTDLHFPFLDFVAQKANYRELMKPVAGIIDDVYNLSASLAKISHFHKTKNILGGGDVRMVQTEVEYIFSVCRSMIDLFQEVACKLWDNVRLHPDQVIGKKKDLKKSFSKMVLHDSRPATLDELQKFYGLPKLWAHFYTCHTGFFLQLRKYRDNIVHHGTKVDFVFSADNGYMIDKDFKPFREIIQWRDADVGANNSVPLMSALGMLVYRVFLLCDHFSMMIEKCIECLPCSVPNMDLYVRGYFDAHFLSVFKDADKRVGENSMFYFGLET